jgi:hypothetical protein
MAKGWVVARLLGYVSNDRIRAFHDSRGAAPLAIWTSGGDKNFPSPLLDVDFENSRSYFPALMESFMLAFLDLSSGESDSLEAYAQLGRLGTESPRWISQWVAEGLLEGSPTSLSHLSPDAAVAGQATQSAAERQALVKEELTRRRDSLMRDVVSLPETDMNFNHFDREWELRHVMLSALDQLLEAVDHEGGVFRPGDA